MIRGTALPKQSSRRAFSPPSRAWKTARSAAECILVKDIATDSPSLVMRRDDAVSIPNSENQPIVACSQEDWDLVTKIIRSGDGSGDTSVRSRTAFQGEVNETTDGKKGNISDNPKDGPQILRGSAICLYALRGSSHRASRSTLAP